MSEKTQLTRITIPAITDARYIEGMADAFDKINDNFKKIASLPFLQGVQGDSYQLEEYKIWNDDLSITEDGKVLLDSIFGKDVTVKGNYFTDIRLYIDELLDDVSPLDFFVAEDGNTIINNALYFYVIKDDTGNVIEKQLGQYYYFVDGRLKNIGNVYNGDIQGVSLDGFNDYTGFYQYKYNPKSYNQTYLKVEILPSIYYDQDKNDICWKFNGNETGISAIGVKGADGKDADLLIVKVTANENDCVGIVNAIINPIGANTAAEEDQWIEDTSYFKEGKALICIQRSGVAQDFAYGHVIKFDSEFNAYWEPNYVFSKLIGNNRITNYFYNMGADDTATSPFFLAIPSVYNRTSSGKDEDKKKAHIIKGYESETDDTLNIFYSEGAFDTDGNQEQYASEASKVKSLHIKNYNVSLDNNFGVDGTSIFNDNVQLNGDLNVNGDLEVTNKSTLNGDLEVGGTVLINNGSSSNNINEGALVVKGGVGLSGKLNVGEDVVIENKLTVKGNSGATNERNADVVMHGGVGIGKDVIVGSSGKMKIKNRGVVYNYDNTIKPNDAALNVNGDIYSKNNIIAKCRSEGLYSVLTGANDSNIARGSSGLKSLVEANREGTIFSGGGTQATIGSSGLNRTVYNRAALQSYHTKLKGSSKLYEPLEYHINPCGGQVLVNKYAGHGGTGSKTLSASNALVVDGGLYARTKKPTSVVDKGDADGLSNVLIGHNDPGNSQFEDFPKDLDKGGYPLVIKSLQKDGTTVSNGAMVFGMGDIYSLSGNNTTGYTAGTLCLNHRTRYRGDVQIGRNLNVGDNDLGGNLTVYSTDDSNGRLIVKGTTGSTNTSTGALVVTGGVGIGGAVNIGGKITGSSGIKIIGRDTYGIDMYSGVGAATDNNILKVNGSAVYVSGTKGLLSAHKITADTAGIYERSNGGTKEGITYTLSDLITNNEGNVYCGGINDPEAGKNVYRTIHNRSSVQSYEHKNNNGTQQYTGVTFYINPCGGTVTINQRVSRGGLFKSSTSTTTGALVVNGGVGISENLNAGGSLRCGGSFSVESQSSSFGGNIYMEDGGELTAYLDNVDINEFLNVGSQLVVNKDGLNGGSAASEIYGFYANKITGGSSDGGTGLVVYGGSGKETNDNNHGNGGVGLIVRGGTAGNFTGSTYSDAGYGGTGLVVYGGQAGSGPGISNTGHTGAAIKTYGDVIICDRTGSHLTTLSSNSTGLKINDNINIQGIGNTKYQTTEVTTTQSTNSITLDSGSRVYIYDKVHTGNSNLTITLNKAKNNIDFPIYLLFKGGIKTNAAASGNKYISIIVGSKTFNTGNIYNNEDYTSGLLFVIFDKFCFVQCNYSPVNSGYFTNGGQRVLY